LQFRRTVKLMADRFLITEQATIDLATGRTVVLRQLPACEARDEQRWSATCARLAMLWHEDMSSLVDYGVLADSRFEAYDRPDAPLWNHHASEAVIAFLADAGLADSGPRPSNRTGARGPVRLGVRVIAQRGLGLLGDLLEDGRSGSARVVVCSGEPGAGRTTFLQLAAAEGRRRGYAALSVNTLERWPELAASFRDRHVLVLCDSEAPSAAGERWLLRFARWSPAGHVLLRAAGERTGSADVTLVLAAHAPHALVRCLSVYPPAALSEHHVERAAVRSGGLPGPFLTALRPDRGARVALRWLKPAPHTGPRHLGPPEWIIRGRT
jgi:hypothetical protein